MGLRHVWGKEAARVLLTYWIMFLSVSGIIGFVFIDLFCV